MKISLDFLSYYSQNQWAIILESISFVLVTLDLYGSERLENLNQKIDSIITKYINQIKGTFPFRKIQRKNKFIMTSIKYLWIALTSPVLLFWNQIRRIFNYSKLEVSELSEEETKQLDKFITIVFYIGVGTVLLSVLLLIYFIPSLAEKLNIVYIGFYFSFALVGLLLATVVNKIWINIDWIPFFKLVLIAPLYILALLVLTIFIIVFIIYFYLVPTLLIIPLEIVNIFLKGLLFVIVRFKLKNIMLLFGSILFFISKYLSFVS